MDPLTWLFASVVRARNARYDRGTVPVRKLNAPVISIGNISVGGTGKTPFVQMLGRWLAEHGVPYDILSRGYGRKSRGVLRVDPGGDAAQFGDEPLLLARSLGAPVYVGEDRFEAGVTAERELGPRLHLLDDGFQHRKLHRDFDIVLLAASDIRGKLLPFGRLREPLSSLARASAVAIPSDIAGLFETASPGAGPILWRVRRTLVLPEPAPTRPIAFCGLARPEQFWASLEQVGIQPVATWAFKDHHRYSTSDYKLLRSLAERQDANGFITTEKDLVKLDRSALQPLVAPALTVEVEDADTHFEQMLRSVGIPLS